MLNNCKFQEKNILFDLENWEMKGESEKASIVVLNTDFDEFIIQF